MRAEAETVPPQRAARRQVRLRSPGARSCRGPDSCPRRWGWRGSQVPCFRPGAP